MCKCCSGIVTQNNPFLHTGIDYAEPFEILSTAIRKGATQKCYFALFICFATKPVYLELVTDLSTARFLAAFRRFVGRRGLPACLYSDQGRNFIGTAKELVELFNRCSKANKELRELLSMDNVDWKFNPAHAPHHGGFAGY